MEDNKPGPEDGSQPERGTGHARTTAPLHPAMRSLANATKSMTRRRPSRDEDDQQD
jgi:hypothetical protein